VTWIYVIWPIKGLKNWLLHSKTSESHIYYHFCDVIKITSPKTRHKNFHFQAPPLVKSRLRYSLLISLKVTKIILFSRNWSKVKRNKGNRTLNLHRDGLMFYFSSVQTIVISNLIARNSKQYSSLSCRCSTDSKMFILHGWLEGCHLRLSFSVSFPWSCTGALSRGRGQYESCLGQGSARNGRLW